MAEQVRIDLIAEDKASDVIDDVADAVDDLQRLEPEVQVGADTADAIHGLADVKSEAAELDGTDSTITATLTNQVSGPLADIFADLDKLQTRAKEAGDKLNDVGREAGGPSGGPRLAGNAVADLTGPLGDASGAASDFGGVMDGVSDIAEKTAIKLGLSEDAAAGLAGTLGGVGFLIAGVAAAWSYFSQKSAEAAAKQKEILDNQRKLNDALKTGDVAKAAQQIVDSYGDAFDAADKLKLGVDDVTRYITGQTDVIPGMTQAIGWLNDQIAANSSNVVTLTQDFNDNRDAIEDARRQYLDANGALATQDQRLADVTGGLDRFADKTDDGAKAQDRLKQATDDSSAAMDELRGKLNMDQAMNNLETSFTTAFDNIQSGAGNTADDVLNIKSQILDVAESAHANPIEVASTLQKVDQGDLAGAKADAERWYQNNPVQLTAQLKLLRQQLAWVGAPGQAITVTAAGAPVVNVTQYVPRGFRGDVLAQARAAARRSGGLYMRAAR